MEKRRKLKLRSLSVRNFRSIANLKICFGSQITCIRGESYAGKSNLVRALRLITTNSPAGTTYIRRNTTQTTIILGTTRGTIKRVRGKAKNTYQVGEQVYKSFGKDIPAAVKHVVNLSDTNFQLQQEVPHGVGPLFWFALKPKEIIGEINKIVNLSQIDSIIKILAKKLGTAKTTERVLKKKRDETWTNLKEVHHAPEMKSNWNKVERVFTQADKLKNTISSLRHTLLDIKSRQVFISKLSAEVDNIEEDWIVVTSAYNILKDTYRQTAELRNLITKANIKKRQIQDLKAQYHDLKEQLGNICPECGKPL